MPIQGVGLFCLEEMVWKADGSLFTKGPSTYKIPSFNDIPIDFRVSLYNSEKGHDTRTVYGSKGIGEPPLMLATSGQLSFPLAICPPSVLPCNSLLDVFAVYLAIRDAIRSARADAKCFGTFRLDSPATAERIRMACPDDITRR